MPLPLPPHPLVRKDIWKLTSDAEPWDPISIAYARAVAAMQRTREDHPESWEYQAAVHGTYAENPRPDWNMCQHGTWFFLPWHRMYIYMFERIIRSHFEVDVPDDWALPYWDWTKNPRLPAPFRQEKLPDGEDNPLLISQRNAALNRGATIRDIFVSTDYAMSFTNFSAQEQTSPINHSEDTGFGGADTHGEVHHAGRVGTGGLEDQPHNILHDIIGGGGRGQCEGGLMSDPNCAARDPIFWLHHSNIDRLWSRWLDKGGARVNPTSAHWTKHEFTFRESIESEVFGQCGEVGFTTQLDYGYDDDPPPVARPFLSLAAVPAPASAGEGAGGPAEGGGEVQVLGEATNVALGDAPKTEPIQLGDEARAVTEALKSGDPAQARGLHLTIDGITVDANPGIVYGIYLNEPGADENTGHRTRHFVGLLSFFGAQHAGEHGPASRTFDIASLVHQLIEAGRWDENEATVTFVPLGIEPQEGISAEDLDQGPLPDIELQRVTLTS